MAPETAGSAGQDRITDSAALTVTRCHPLARCEHCHKAASYDVTQQDGTAESVCGDHIGRAIGRVLYNASEVLRHAD